MIAILTDVEFTAPLPGLGGNTSFTLERIDGAEGLFALRSASDGLRLFLLDPASGDYALPGGAYRPVLGAGVRAQIGAEEESDIQVLVVANPADDGVSLNLRAPIVVHRGTGRAAQVILDDQSYPIRALLNDGISR